MLLKAYWGKLVILFMQILRASEDYLETMLMMQQQHGYIRSIDVAEHLGVTKPSVTYATKRLRGKRLHHDGQGRTHHADGPAAWPSPRSMLDRHHTLTKFLMALGVDADTAEDGRLQDRARHQPADVRGHLRARDEKSLSLSPVPFKKCVKSAMHRSEGVWRFFVFALTR